MDVCDSTHRTYFHKGDPYACDRDMGHPGDHQNIEHGWVWSRGGSRSISPGAFDCPSCGTRRVESDLIKERVEGDQCASCDFWDLAAERYISGESFAVNGRMYTWAPSKPWGFDGAIALITKSDGSTLGPGPGLWDNGQIPHERRNVLVDNATIEWKGRA